MRNILNDLPSTVEPVPCHWPSSGEDGTEVVAGTTGIFTGAQEVKKRNTNKIKGYFFIGYFHQHPQGSELMESRGSFYILVKEFQRAEHEFKPRLTNERVTFALLGKYLRIFVNGNEAIIHFD